jgi:hypothetical protein
LLDFRAFRALQEKARRHLPPHASLRRVKLGVSARESAKGELESKCEKAKTTDVKIQKISLFRRYCEGLCRSHGLFYGEQKSCVVILNNKSKSKLKGLIKMNNGKSGSKTNFKTSSNNAARSSIKQ